MRDSKLNIVGARPKSSLSTVLLRCTFAKTRGVKNKNFAARLESSVSTLVLRGEKLCVYFYYEGIFGKIRGVKLKNFAVRPIVAYLLPP